MAKIENQTEVSAVFILFFYFNLSLSVEMVGLFKHSPFFGDGARMALTPNLR